MDDASVDGLLARYLRTIATLAEGRRWYESPTSMRLGALHLTARRTEADALDVNRYSSAIIRSLSRVDPLRPFASSMAALALATNATIEDTLDSLAGTVRGFAESSRPFGKTDRARAVPCLVFHSDGMSPVEAANRVRGVHQAWNSQHRWLTTGRHVSFAAMAVGAGIDSDQTATCAAEIHDLLNGRGMWHEWDASILLSFGRQDPEKTVDRYEAVVAGFMGDTRKPPTVARDDLAVVTLASGQPQENGMKLADYVRRLRELRPRPSLQVALAVAATLVLAEGTSEDGRSRALLDGFALYSYAEALREESPD